MKRYALRNLQLRGIGDGRALHELISDDEEETFIKMLALSFPRVDVNAKITYTTDSGEQHQDVTLLHLAVRHCRPRIVRALLNYGGDVNMTDAKGKKPLHYFDPNLLEPAIEIFKNQDMNNEAVATLQLLFENGTSKQEYIERFGQASLDRFHSLSDDNYRDTGDLLINQLRPF